MSEKCEKCGQPTEYNGWTNYESWAVYSWLSSYEGTYDRARHLVRGKSKYEAGTALKSWIAAEENPLLDKPASLYQDLLGAALDAVDWDEVAAGFMEE